MSLTNEIDVSWVRNLDWSDPKQINTKHGPKLVMHAAPNQQFWTAWKDCRDCVKDAGFSVRKLDNGSWQVTCWTDPDDEPLPQAVPEPTHTVPLFDDPLGAAALPEVASIPLPPGHELLPFQEADVKRMATMPAVLLASDMGSGKTVQIAALANAVRAERVLIVAPARLLMNWQAELAEWLLNPAPAMIVTAKNASEIPHHIGPIIVGYEMAVRPNVLPHLRAVHWDLAAFDEAQAFGNHESQRTIGLIGRANPIKATRRVLASGTPFRNRPIELWPLLRYLEPKRWHSRHEYGLRYCAGHIDQDGHWNYQGASNLDELNRALRYGVMIRRTKEDVLAGLPPKTDRLIIIEPDDQQRELIKREQDLQKIGRVDINEIALQMGAVELGDDENLARVRADLAMTKFGAIARHVESIAQGGEKCVLFVHHRALVDALMERWDGSAVKIVGGQTAKQTHKAVQAFQEQSAIRVAVCSIRAAGAGLTLTAANRVVFGESDWAPGQNDQAAARCHRIGQTRSVTVEHLVLDGSLDKLLYGVTAKKRRAAREAFA